LMLSRRLDFCFDRVAMSGRQEKCPQVSDHARGVGVTSHYLHSLSNSQRSCCSAP
jgi:hypothetical protein